MPCLSLGSSFCGVPVFRRYSGIPLLFRGVPAIPLVFRVPLFRVPVLRRCSVVSLVFRVPSFRVPVFLVL